MLKQTLNAIVAEVTEAVSQADERQATVFVERMAEARKIFIAGNGRSGVVGKAFAMRLMQAGLTVFVVGETITPSIGKGDLLVVISGSGNNVALGGCMRKAKGACARTALITASADAPLAGFADCCLLLPAIVKESSGMSRHGSSLQPLGSQFNQCAQLVLDAVVIEVINKLDIDPASLAERHANLE
ncbi:MAG: hxlB [Paenibacillus sp.]|nr:hxlB [Paenibacillus sp.]